MARVIVGYAARRIVKPGGIIWPHGKDIPKPPPEDEEEPA